MEKIIDLYEDIETIEVKLNGDEAGRKRFKAPSSLHSVVTDWAYGTMIEKDCFDISNSSNALQGFFQLKDTKKRFYLKINACLFDWEKYENDITVLINGKALFDNKKIFLENVNIGWPSIYFSVENTFLEEGKNCISVSTKNSTGAGLLIAEIKILSLPQIVEYMQISARQYVKENALFSVAVQNKRKDFVSVEETENCSFEKATYFNDICVVTFHAKTFGNMYAKLKFVGGVVELKMPQTIENKDNFLVGLDSDDHRHDDSEETDRILHTAIFSDMGNFLQFRPKYKRNYMQISSEQIFCERVELLSLFGMKYGLCDKKGDLSYLPAKHSDSFLGYHVHEPYHFFNFSLEGKTFFSSGEKFDFQGLRESNCFENSKCLYQINLREKKERLKNIKGLTSVGSPSLLCVYEGDAGFDRITIEPVSNLNILVGAVRATDVKCWGAHIPTDWYFGVPVNEIKSAKFRLAMQYAYLNGASYVYAENSLFKTNAFERLDFEDEHCRLNRKYLRDFYQYTLKNPREGKLIVDKAIVYGRNEFFMWQTNDRMAELKEKDWDSFVWGKWDNSYHKCWQAAEAWMPISEKQCDIETPLNTKLFAGSPYGSIDVVSAEKEFERYNTIAFLGWNTMDELLFERLKEYVYNGGNVIISYCHFNTVDRNDQPCRFIDCTQIGEFVGLNIDDEFSMGGRISFLDGTTFIADEKLTIVTGKTVTAEKLCEDSNGNGLFYRNTYGKGQVYFCAFKEYFAKQWAVDAVSHLLSIVGANGDIVCDNKNISFTVRELENNKFLIHVLNMNCLQGAKEQFTLRFRDKTISDSICVGEIKQYTITD